SFNRETARASELHHSLPDRIMNSFRIVAGSWALSEFHPLLIPVDPSAHQQGCRQLPTVRDQRIVPRAVGQSTSPPIWQHRIVINQSPAVRPIVPDVFVYQNNFFARWVIGHSGVKGFRRGYWSVDLHPI